MKIIYLLPILFFLSCDSQEMEKTKINRTNKSLNGNTIEEVEIEGCEYLWIPRYKGVGLTHKGNCKNKFHNN